MDTLTRSSLVAPPLPLRLLPGDVHWLADRRLRGARLVVLRGRLWVTQAGSPEDHFLAAGSELPLRAKGAVVLECDGAEPAELRLLRRPGLATRCLAAVSASQVAFAAIRRAALRRLLPTKSPLLETRPTAVLPRLRRTP